MRATWYSQREENGVETYCVRIARQEFVEIYPETVITGKYYILDPNGNLLILPGFEWDGASGPAIDCKSNMRASMVHDCLYGMISRRELRPKGWHRKRADLLFRKMLVKDGMSRFRAWYYWLGVRAAGWRHC